MRLEAASTRVYFDSPHLPESIHELTISGLKVGDGSVDISAVRQDTEVALRIKNRSGNVGVIVRH